MKSNLSGLAVGLALLSGVQSVNAQLVGTTSETLVNTGLTDSTQQNAAVSMDTLGRYVVVWESEGQDGDGFGIYAKIYNADHSVRVSDFKVNTSENVRDQRFPDVAMNADGTFCVVWQSNEDEGWSVAWNDWQHQGWDIYRKIYDIDGGAAFRSRVNSTTSGNQMHPAVAAADGHFVFTYMSEVSGQNESEIKGRVCLSNGSWLMGDILIDSSTGKHMAHPDIAVTPNTEYAITWQADSSDGDRNGIYTSLYNSSYTLVSGPTQVNTTTTGNQQEPSIAMDENGEYMIVWSSFDQDGDHYGIYGQLFDNTGVASGSEMAITSNTVGSQDHAAVAVTRGGENYTITWTDDATEGDRSGVYGRSMKKTGAFSDVDLLINTTTSEYQMLSDVAQGNDSTEAVFVWQSGLRGLSSQTDPSRYGIYSQGFTVTDITPPVAVCQNITVYLDGTGNVTITATDIDGGSSDNIGIVSMTAGTTAFDCSDIGLNTSALTVYDAAGLSDGCVAAVIVADTTSPIAICQNVTGYLDGTGNALINASDIDGGSTDNCTTVTLSSSQTAFTCADVGTNTITLTVTDGSGNISTCVSTVTILDTVSPSASCQNITAYLDGTGIATVPVGDIDAGSSDNCSIAILNASQTTFTCADIGANSVTLLVTDPSGNTSSCTATVTIVDSTSPSVVCQNITAYLSNIGNVFITTGDIDAGTTDNCGSVTLSLDNTVFTCIHIGTNNVTLTATDDAGNISSCVAVVTIADTSSPIVVCSDITVNLDGTGNATITTGDIAVSGDNCSVTTLSLDVSAFDCTMLGANTVTVTAVDGSGNTSSCTSTVTIYDITDPIALCQDVTVYLDGTGNASITTGDVDNGSTDNCTLSLNLDITDFTCSDIGTNTVTLTATDQGAGSATCTSTVTVIDSTSPSAVCQNITAYLDGSGNVTITAADIDGGSTDNCTTVTLGASQTAFTCADAGANTVTLTVTDGSGNISTCTSTVTIIDSTSPSAVCQNITVYLDGFGTASIVAADLDGGSTDNCSTVTLTATQTMFMCANTGANTVTLNVTDGSGNLSSCTAIVTVVDSTSPSAVCQDITAYLDGAGNVTITAADIDGGSSDQCGAVTLSASQTAFTCSSTGANTVTLTVTDLSGNSSTCTATVTVLDTLAPTMVCQNTIVYIDAAGIGTLLPADIDGGSTDNCGAITFSVSNPTFDCSDAGMLAIVTLTGTDASGNSASCLATAVGILDTISPTAVCQDVTVYLDGTGSASITAGDIDGGSADNCTTITLGASQNTFTCADAGTNTVTLTVTDASANTSSCTATVTVIDSTSPSAVCQDITAYLDGAGNVTITAADIDNGSSDNCTTVTLSASQTAFTCADAGTNTVTLTVTDASANTSSCTATVTIIDSTSPSAVCQNITAYLDGSGNVTITAADIDGGSTDNCTTVTLSASQTAFTCADAGTNTVTLTVTDASANTSSCTATVTIIDSTSPSAVCQNITAYLDGTGNATITAADIDGGSTDNCTTVTLAASQTAFTCADAGTNTVTLTVTDASANTSSCTATVTIIDSTSPSAVCQNITAYLDGAGNVTITAADIDNGSSDNCTTVTLSASQTAFTCADAGTNTVTLTVTDASANTSSCTATVTIIDSTSPSAVCQNITVYLDGSGNATIAAADIDGGSADNCTTVTLAASQTAFTCADAGANTVTLTVTDASANTSSCTATVTILDSTSPSAVCQNITAYLDGSGNVTITAADIDGGSSDNCTTITLGASQTAFTCADAGANAVILTVTDASGNSSTCTSTVTVLDTIAPTAICQNVSIQLDAAGNATLATINSGSSDNCGITSMVMSQTAFTCADLGANTITMTVTDNSGNVSTCSSIVTVLDNILPTTVCQPFTAYLDASGNVTITGADIDGGSFDNCSIASMTVSTTAFTCADIGANTVTLTVFDPAGNSTQCTATVTVADSTAPIVACLDTTIYLDAAGNASITTGDLDNGSTDNCSTVTLAIDASTFDCSSTGANTVTLTVTDGSGNVGTCTSTVTVLDTIVPVLTACPSDIIAPANLPGCMAAPLWAAPTESDNCTVTLTSSHNSGDLFPVGTTTVTYTATDASGNTTSCSFDVTVTSNLNATATSVAETTGGDGSIDLTVTGGAPGGYSYSWSNSAITEDLNGLTGNATYTVVVTDQIGCTDTLDVFVDSYVDVIEVAAEDELELIVFPNPTIDGKFTIQFKGDWVGTIVVEMVDARGRIIYQESTTEEELHVNLQDLQLATYFIQARDEQGKVLVSRIVKVEK